MGYKTNDGYELNEGEPCFVYIQDPYGVLKRTKLYESVYMDKVAKNNGWDFTINGLGDDADYEWEVTHVYKYNPIKEKDGK